MPASKIFVAADQSQFAALTGDYNPMHMDPIAARRTLAGAPVVHGVHTLLWLLESLASQHPAIEKIAVLKVRFSKMVYVGDRVEARITHLGLTSLRAQVCVGGLEVMNIVAELGPFRPATTRFSSGQPDGPLIRQVAPADLTFEEMEKRSGRVAFYTDMAEMERAFPSAARLLGPRRLAALGCSTYLVGMVVPGLHSLYGGLDLQFTADITVENELAFEVSSVDSRFRTVQLKISGAGLSGSLHTFARVPPVLQPSMAIIAEHVVRGEFDGSTALVVGGSRGLGELTAKVIAAGGGKVIVTYASGKADAEKLAAEINSWGGLCNVAAYDVRRDAEEQLKVLDHAPTHLYYFATPTISKRKSGLCAPERFTEFNEFYVHGFLRFVEAAIRRSPAGISVFYPSSVFVQERPQDMTEYAMSKAAGEILCADIAKCLKNVRVLTERLPRLPTDQTASLIQANIANPLSVMLPIIRKMHERIDAGGTL